MLVETLGHTYVKATFYNAADYVEYVKGKRKLEDVRKLEQNTLVDTGATFPALPEDKVKDLGLPFMGEHEAEVAEGKGKLKLTYAVTQVEDRTAISYIIIRPKGTTPLIGVVALEQMGYRVDPTTGKLIKGWPLML
jgi:predicted aspartyl protease